jgi:hypothetical protein
MDDTHDMDVDELDNTRNIANHIFTRPPGLKNSIQLELEEQTADIATREGVDKFIFEILSVLTMHGIEILFGHRNILRLSESDFDLVQQYTNSYGYRINKRIDEESRLLLISFEKIY